MKYGRKHELRIGRIEDRGREGFTKLGLPRKKLGRPADPYKHLPLEEQRKAYLEMHAAGERLSLEQTRIALWNPKTEKAPLSKMAVLKIEQQALAKLKAKLSAMGIKSLDDVFSPNRDEPVTTVDLA